MARREIKIYVLDNGTNFSALTRIKRAAALSGKSVSQWAYDILVRAADNAVAQSAPVPVTPTLDERLETIVPSQPPKVVSPRDVWLNELVPDPRYAHLAHEIGDTLIPRRRLIELGLLEDETALDKG